jgi:hypothetical protein
VRCTIVIADPGSNSAAVETDAAAAVEVCPLTPTELYQLTLYKWRYSLEAYGFARQEVRELMFVKWLHASRRLEP